MRRRRKVGRDPAFERFFLGETLLPPCLIVSIADWYE